VNGHNTFIGLIKKFNAKIFSLQAEMKNVESHFFIDSKKTICYFISKMNKFLFS